MLVVQFGLSSRVCMLRTVSLITTMYPEPTHSIAATICASNVRPPGRMCTSGKWCVLHSSTYLYHSGVPPGIADDGDTNTFTLSRGTPSLRNNDNVFPHSSVGRSNDGMTSLYSIWLLLVLVRLSCQCFTVPAATSFAVMGFITGKQGAGLSERPRHRRPWFEQ